MDQRWVGIKIPRIIVHLVPGQFRQMHQAIQTVCILIGQSDQANRTDWLFQLYAETLVAPIRTTLLGKSDGNGYQMDVTLYPAERNISQFSLLKVSWMARQFRRWSIPNRTCHLKSDGSPTLFRLSINWSKLSRDSVLWTVQINRTKANCNSDGALIYSDEWHWQIGRVAHFCYRLKCKIRLTTYRQMTRGSNRTVVLSYSDGHCAVQFLVLG